MDKSSEVKHALTPIDRVPTETRSPQLPLPSPNYPVQAQSMLDAPLLTVSSSVTGTGTYSPHVTSHIDTDNVKLDSSAHSTYSTNKSVHKNSVKNQEYSINLKASECGPKVITKKSLKSNLKVLNGEKSRINNFTVLNIPNISLTGPPVKRQKVSKIDLAMIKHKMRKRNYCTAFDELSQSYRKDKVTYSYGLRITGPSDSSSSSLCSSSDSESEHEVDICIKSGPPLKPDLTKRKLEFLKIFNLTTHNLKNSKLWDQK